MSQSETSAIDRPELLVLVRHGESQHNIAPRKNNIYLTEEAALQVKGIPDHKVPLTERGELQAQITGEAIRKKFGVFDVVYDSDYLRTITTREGLLSSYTEEEMAQMKIRHHHWLRERERGYTFNMTTAEVEKYFPWFQEYWETFGPFYSRPPGGQSQADLCDQVHRFIGLLFKYRAGQKVIVATHGHTLRACRFNLEKWSADDYMKSIEEGQKFSNCGVTTYRYNPQSGRLELEELNQVYWQ